MGEDYEALNLPSMHDSFVAGRLIEYITGKRQEIKVRDTARADSILKLWRAAGLINDAHRRTARWSTRAAYRVIREEA